MIKKLIFYLKLLQNLQRINMALSRAAATSPLRRIDPTNPPSWEFSAFSQNGEDGIIDFLLTEIKNPNRYFIEIGSSDGIENNSSWLALAKKYNGLMIEGDTGTAKMLEQIFASLNLGIDCLSMFVTKQSITQIKERSLYLNPDVFSLDIDGCDYYIAEDLMKAGFRPKICVVEYNSAFGPHNSVTIKYSDSFDYRKAHESNLYFGVSIAGWKAYFLKWGYKFVSVDQNGVDAFFIDPIEFDSTFINNLRGLDFRENFYLKRKFKASWEKQYEIIKDMGFVEIH